MIASISWPQSASYTKSATYLTVPVPSSPYREHTKTSRSQKPSVPNIVRRPNTRAGMPAHGQVDSTTGGQWAATSHWILHLIFCSPCIIIKLLHFKPTNALNFIAIQITLQNTNRYMFQASPLYAGDENIKQLLYKTVYSLVMSRWNLKHCTVWRFVVLYSFQWNIVLIFIFPCKSMYI